MIFLAVTADTWIVTGLGFGIVLGLLFCLVFILQFFGWIMQGVAKGEWRKAKASDKKQPVVKQEAKEESAQAPKECAEAQDDYAAVAFALFLASRDGKHDAPTSMISLNAQETAWNTKSIGLN